MQTGLENKSLRKKLVFTSMLVTGLAVLVGLIISIVEDVRYTRQSTQEQLVILADLVAANSAPALVFSDKAAAIETLNLLKINKHISSATILDQNKLVFVSFKNDTTQPTAWQLNYPNVFEVNIDRPIHINNEAEGLLILTANMTKVWQLLVTQWLTKLLVLSAIFLISYLILRQTSNYVLDPIQRLGSAIREIIDRGDYSLRVDKLEADELGELTEEFNVMLSKIEDRDNQLQQSNEALAQVQEPIMLRDAELRCLYVNPVFTSLFGYTLEELKGKTFSLQVQGEVGSEHTQEEIYKIAKQKGVYRGETLRQTKDGRVLPMQRHISPVKKRDGEVKGYVTVLTDISEKKRAEEIIWRQANFDALTGLPNRLMFLHRLKDELANIKRTQQPLALMFLDLDHFKEINDTLGHDMGDELLKQAAKRIVSCLRDTDTVGYMESETYENVARLGGDEFTIILGDLKEADSADIVARRVLDQLSEPFQLGNDLVHISASIGIVETYPNESVNAETLVKYADIAMYESKQYGRNRYSKFCQSMLHEAQKRRNLINDIHNALRNEEFQVVYQPIIDIKTNQVIKAEALIRWHHPKEGLVSPNDFISAAEDAGLIVEIGDWVFKEAVKQTAVWRRNIHKDFQISINKSPVQLNTKDEVKLNWFDCLAEYHLPGNGVIVEITEGVFLNKNKQVTDRLLALRGSGMQISLDDFGTGYSSLSYLLKMDIDYIKIDQSFVKNLSINSEDMILCEAMIVMAHKLGIKVVAEGIETQQQLDILTAAGCDFGQGYLLSKPLSSKAFERFCNNRVDHESLVA
jgi:diguanylate cyclase (GGDEF)-like protein/PAS domain S-box-containing protein